MDKYKTHCSVFIPIIIFTCMGCQNKTEIPTIQSSPVIIVSPTPTIKPISP
ncbi:MAG: hypothetical protein QNJ64_12995 [Crocosphaera sp.]|nr:hypothetical protein [Crocosphaera sp.]